MAQVLCVEQSLEVEIYQVRGKIIHPAQTAARLQSASNNINILLVTPNYRLLIFQRLQNPQDVEMFSPVKHGLHKIKCFKHKTDITSAKKIKFIYCNKQRIYILIKLLERDVISDLALG